MIKYSCVLVQSDLNSAKGDVAGLGQWNTVAVARVGEHYYLSSSSFDPVSYPASTPIPHLIE